MLEQQDIRVEQLQAEIAWVRTWAAQARISPSRRPGAHADGSLAWPFVQYEQWRAKVDRTVREAAEAERAARREFEERANAAEHAARALEGLVKRESVVYVH